MMGTEIFKIDASWAEKSTKTRVSFLMTPTVDEIDIRFQSECPTCCVSVRTKTPMNKIKAKATRFYFAETSGAEGEPKIYPAVNETSKPFLFADCEDLNRME